MTDELERLKQALGATAPEPDPQARARASAAAMAAFDVEAAQGSAAPARPKRQRAGWLARLFGGLAVDASFRPIYPILAGAACVAVLVVAWNFAENSGRYKASETPNLSPDELIASLPTATESRREGGPQGLAGRRDSAAAGNEIFATAPAESDSPAAPRQLTDEDLSQSAGAGPATKMVDGDRQAVTDQMATSSAEAPAPAPGTVWLWRGGDVRNVPVGQPDAAAPEQRAGMTEAKRMQAPPMPQEALQERETAPPAYQDPAYQDQGRDRFADFETNPVQVVAEAPVSTFSIDVDTASYAFVRRQILAGVLPQKDAVRVEEMVNYFPYDYPLPESRETPFRADVQVIPTPWNAGTQVMRIGIQGYALAEAEKPRANLVFLVDSSGSMQAPDKLPLLKNALKLMLDALDPDDKVAIVTYAGAAGTVLEPTPVAEASRILAALERLRSGGSTAGAEGIRQAYRLAEANFDPDGVNRVILATDGDFNVGITDPGELRDFVERKRETGILLSVLGFGQGNLNDALMQALAQNGNGQAAYIDTLSEARKALVEEAGGALFPIAQDVKIQVEFNPAAVAEYRLIGYETRMLRREDFNNDKVDAGEIGSGHRVTALYEITPAGSQARQVDALRYQQAAVPEANPAELAFVKIRYKQPGGSVSRLIETPVTRAAAVDPEDARSRETRFAAAVAGFGQLLRGGRHMGGFGYDDVAALAQGAKGDDPYGYRAEFVNLVRLAKSAAAMEPLKP